MPLLKEARKWQVRSLGTWNILEILKKERAVGFWENPMRS